ncbi:hypothetical protein HB777_06845 [Mesorhizobium loti]|nr:hypothetical protein HB777_06845 [Mesorhizobium loti]
MDALTLDGFSEPVGILARDDNGGVAYAYRPDYRRGGQALGIESAAARKRIRASHTADIAASLARQLNGLDKRNMKRFADLIASNIGTLTAAFGLAAPAAVEQRDAFLDRAGGWLMS